MPKRCVVSLIVPFVLALGGCSDDAARPVWLTYQRDDGSRIIVVAARADGTKSKELARNIPSGDQTGPDWSPDGSRVVFVVHDAGTDDLWTVNSDGSNASRLLDCADSCRYFDDPAWSPDGTEVMYARTEVVDTVRTNVDTLETVDVLTGKVEVVLTAQPNHFFAGVRYAPDGKSVVVEDVVKSGPHIDDEVVGDTLSVLDLTTPATNLVPLTDPTLFAVTADWAPNGDRIVYSALAQPGATGPDLFTIRPDGTGVTRITTLADSGGAAEEPAWLPNGTAIFFYATLKDGRGLAQVSSGGGTVSPAIGDTYINARHPRLVAKP